MTHESSQTYFDRTQKELRSQRQENVEVVGLLRDAKNELAALVERPDAPDFRPATRNDNPADAECLERAYNFIHTAIMLMEHVR